MPKFLVAIPHPDDSDRAAVENASIKRDIDVLNQEMIAAGVRVLAMGLHPARHAVSLRAAPDGTVVQSDGPYLPTAEHMGGFWILDVATMDDALAWGKKAVKACRAPVEVRRFY